MKASPSAESQAAGTVPRTGATGTRPEGVENEAEASRYVQEMFGRIAPRYDFLNHLLSLSLDRMWRRWTARRFSRVLGEPDARIVDICCGTGDLTLALERFRKRVLASAGISTAARNVTGADFVQPMLIRAAEKARHAKSNAAFLAADSLSLPLADSTVDLVTVAFGLRNLSNYERGLREIARVLRPGGELGILEFSEPRAWPMAPLYRFYFRYILPRIGKALSGNASAYSYLPASVAKFPSPEELSERMRNAGFRDIRFESWTFGIVALHVGKR